MGAPENSAPTFLTRPLFAVVFYTISFIDPADDCPIIFVLDTNKDVCFLEFFFEVFVPLVCPKRCFNLPNKFWMQIVGVPITCGWESLRLIDCFDLIFFNHTATHHSLQN